MHFGKHSARLAAANRYVVIILAFAIIGIVTLLVSRAASGTTSLHANSGAKQGNVASLGTTAVQFGRSGTCGKQVQNYTYQVPFGNAIWNQPVCNLPRHPQSADYANRLFQWGHINDGSPGADVDNGKISNDPGFPDLTEINPLGKEFTREVYYASKSTTEKQIGAVSYYSNLDAEGDNTFTPNAKIPWNPAWEASQGGDNEMIIIDDRFDTPTGGRIYYLSGYYPEYPKFPYRKLPPVGCSFYWSNNRLCTYTTSVNRDLQGNYIDYRTYEGYVKDRGVGLSYFATLTTPEEVKANEIRHAIGIAIPNTMYGPTCTTSQMQEPINWSVVGKTCGFAVSPASKFEWGGSTVSQVKDPFKSIYTLDKSIPEGMLFSIDMTYQQIDDWISSRPDLASNKRRADTARIFARAIKDYGMMVVDTTGTRISIQTTGGINPDNAIKWTDLGMGPDEKDDMLDGLLTASNIYVVNPPEATCKNGQKSRFFCEWTSVRYQQ